MAWRSSRLLHLRKDGGADEVSEEISNEAWLEAQMESQMDSHPESDSASNWRLVDDLDSRIDAAWDHLRGNPVVDRIFYTASSLGDWSLIWHLLGALLSFRGGRHRKNFWRTSAALGVESVLVNLVIKSMFRRHRPPPAGDRPLHLRIPVTSSFPSGHACSAVLAAALLSEASRRKWPFWVVAGVVACSRLHVKIHHASDIIGGALLGLILSRIVKGVAPLRRL